MENCICVFCGSKMLVSKRARGYRVECSERFSGCPINGRTHHYPSEKKAREGYLRIYNDVIKNISGLGEKK